MRSFPVVLPLAFVLGGCSSTPNLERTQTRLGTALYQIEVKSIFGLLTSPQRVEAEWDAEAGKACRGRAFEVVSKAFNGELKTGMKGMVECK